MPVAVSSIRLVTCDDEPALTPAELSPPHVPSDRRQARLNRRVHRRLTPLDLDWLRSARIKYGAEVRLLDLSTGGMAIETLTALKPESTVVLELAAPDGFVLVSARVLRCQLVAGEDGARYRSACAFRRPLDLSRFASTAGQPATVAGGTADLTPGADSAPPMSTAWQKVVVRYRDGRVLRGFTCDFNGSRPQLHLVSDPLSGDSLMVPLNQLKALFFVRDFDGDPEYEEQKTFAAQTEGRKLEVTFEDGEVLVGSTLTYRPDGQGFFVQPADKRANNIRVFVAAGSVRHVRFLARG